MGTSTSAVDAMLPQVPAQEIEGTSFSSPGLPRSRFGQGWVWGSVRSGSIVAFSFVARAVVAAFLLTGVLGPFYPWFLETRE